MRERLVLLRSQIYAEELMDQTHITLLPYMEDNDRARFIGLLSDRIPSPVRKADNREWRLQARALGLPVMEDNDV